MILNTLREKAGFLIIGFIGLAVLGFLISDAVSSGAPFWAEARNQVGKIGKEEISYEEFSQQVEQSISQMTASTGQSSANPQITSYAVQQVWRTMLEKAIYSRELDRLGLATGPEELAQALTSDNPHAIARQAFANPQTGQYSSEFALDIYRNRAMMPLQQQQFLLELEQRVQLANTIEKYIDMVSAGIYITSLEMQRNYEDNQRTASAGFVKLDYNSVPDTAVSASDKDLEKYYEENKYRYKQEDELRSFDYVIFEVIPSAADSAAARSEIERLAEEFRTTGNDSLFYMSNANTRNPLVYSKKEDLGPVLADSLFGAEPGTVYGPYFEGGAYKVAKLLDTDVRPDSVRASHILVSQASHPNPEARRDLADSLLQRIRSGQSS
ncbi:MAG TPA: peptidylprolyl isomerase, partial [Anseongella sp.]|nr:peptidylprolyl isomerase [Anseongella sp.]